MNVTEVTYFRVVHDIDQRLADSDNIVYVTTINGIPGLYDDGIYLQEIILTNTICNHQFRLSGCTEFGDIYEVSNFIIGDTYSLLDLETYKKFNLDISKNGSIIDHASEHGNVDLLNWCINSGLEFKYTSDAIDYASQNGHCNVLQWWIDADIDLRYTHKAIHLAFNNNQLEILYWWNNSGLKIKCYRPEIIDFMRRNIKKLS